MLKSSWPEHGLLGLITCASIFVVLTALLVTGSTAVAVPTDQLSFLSSEAITVRFPSADSEYITQVELANAGSARTDVGFILLFINADKVVANPPVTVKSNRTAIDANAVNSFTLTFTLKGTTDPLTGHLVASASGAGPATRSVSVRRDERILSLGPLTVSLVSEGFLGVPLIVILTGGLLGLGLVIIRSRRGKYDLRKFMGPTDFKFGDSFASTFTGLGAILGTALGAGLLPDDPRFLPEAQFVALNVLFGIVLLMGASLYGAFQRPDGFGRVWVFLVAAAVTFVAVYGELVTLLIFLVDASRKVASLPLTLGFAILTVLAGVFLSVYGWTRIDRAYQKGTEGPDPANDKPFDPADASKRSWLAL